MRSEIRNMEGAIASPDPPAEEGEKAAQTDDEDTVHEVVTRELFGTNLGEEDVPTSETPR